MKVQLSLETEWRRQTFPRLAFLLNRYCKKAKAKHMSRQDLWALLLTLDKMVISATLAIENELDNPLDPSTSSYPENSDSSSSLATVCQLPILQARSPQSGNRSSNSPNPSKAEIDSWKRALAIARGQTRNINTQLEHWRSKYKELGVQLAAEKKSFRELRCTNDALEEQISTLRVQAEAKSQLPVENAQAQAEILRLVAENEELVATHGPDAPICLEKAKHLQAMLALHCTLTESNPQASVPTVTSEPIFTNPRKKAPAKRRRLL